MGYSGGQKDQPPHGEDDFLAPVRMEDYHGGRLVRRGKPDDSESGGPKGYEEDSGWRMWLVWGILLALGCWGAYALYQYFDRPIP